MLQTLRFVHHQNLIHRDLQHRGEHHKVINAGQRKAALPFLDALRAVEPQRQLQVMHRKPRLQPQRTDIGTCFY